MKNGNLRCWFLDTTNKRPTVWQLYGALRALAAYACTDVTSVKVKIRANSSANVAIFSDFRWISFISWNVMIRLLSIYDEFALYHQSNLNQSVDQSSVDTVYPNGGLLPIRRLHKYYDILSWKHGPSFVGSEWWRILILVLNREDCEASEETFWKQNM